jgi:hypothetical protein
MRWSEVRTTRPLQSTPQGTVCDWEIDFTYPQSLSREAGVGEEPLPPVVAFIIPERSF